MADPEQAPKPKYSWQTTGGCERCEDMAPRLYPEPPGRPHPHCECTMQPVGYVPGGCQPDSGGIQVQFEGSNHPPSRGTAPDPSDMVELVYEYRLTCDDGMIYEGQVIVSITYQDLFDHGSDIVDVKYNEAYDRVETLASGQCRACPQPPVS